MAATIPTTEPISIIAGDTAKFTRSFSEYSAADGWTLAYELRGPSVLTVAATTDTDGAGFAVTIAAADSGTLLPGLYLWFARASLDGEVYTVDQGTLTVQPNPATAQPGDLQSDAEKELVLVNAQIKELLATPTESYSIGQRSAARRTLAELTTYRGVLIAKLGKQRGQPYPTHAVRFRVSQ
jgi:hypothetical protein